MQSHPMAGTARARVASETQLPYRFIAIVGVVLAAAIYSVIATAQATSPVFRFYNIQKGTHFYTMSTAERDHVIVTYPQFVYEGAVFSAYAQQTGDALPVYRFYNNLTGTHFYTISESEKSYVQQTYPQFIFEGPAYYAPALNAIDGRTGLFRFYNNQTGAHFYTTSASERDHVIQTYPQFIYEGVAYYVYTSGSPGGPGGNVPPKITLAASASAVAVPGQVTLTATASDDDGQVVKVIFYNGSFKLTEMASEPYSLTVNLTSAGDYTYTAVAVDDKGASTTSAAVTVHAAAGGGGGNIPPKIALAVSSTSINAPGPVTLTANASDDDGVVTKVTLYQNGIKIIDLTTAPYVYTVMLNTAGTYAFTAQATDDKGATTTTAPVSVTAIVNTPPPPVNVAADIYRLLNQGTFGFSQTEAARVSQMGITAWVNDQFTQPMSGYPDAVFNVLQLAQTVNCGQKDANGVNYPNTAPQFICYRDNLTPTKVQRMFFTNAVQQPDQLRQRVAWALSQIDVISTAMQNLAIAYPMTRYQNILFQEAFGNFESLLNRITLSPSMGYWLTMVNNDKGNLVTGRVANENYAREILQLFSIGLVELNQDGTPLLDNSGNQIATYGQNEIKEFAKVFTGWTFPKPGTVTTGKNPANYELPMVTYLNGHDTGAKTLLPGPNQNIPAGQTELKDITDAVHNIFMHPNVGPYIGRALIQHLVTSNPSPAYVSRVAAVFNNNGSGVRGDMKAVVRAILLDPDARGNAPEGDPAFGQLRAPVLMHTAMMRALNVNTDGAALSALTGALGQPLYSSPTVFNYFPADFTIPGTVLDGPEFGIHNTTTSVTRTNQVYTMIYSGLNPDPTVPNAVGTKIITTPFEALASTPAAMVDSMNKVLMGGTFPPSKAAIIVNQVSTIPATNALERARVGLYLMLTSYDFQVQH